MESIFERAVDPLTTDFALLHRGRRLTCTEVAAVLQTDPWLSRVRVFQRKTRQPRAAPPDRVPPTAEAARWGVEHEAEALNAYGERTGLRPRRCGFVTHAAHPWLGGVPDGLVPPSELLVEVKCPLGPAAANAPVPPPWYEAQIQTLMQCCGARSCHYVEFRPHESAPHRRLRVVTVLRDDAWFAAALPVLQRFWEDVQAHQPPRTFVVDG